MYDRATRQLEFDTGSTPNQVGPGTYDVDQLVQGHHKMHACAPFLSTSTRQACSNFFDVKEVHNPGPGHYDPAAVQPRVLGCITMTTGEQRFKPRVMDEIPGPGAYSLKRYREDMGDQSHFTKPIMEPRTCGKRITSRIKYTGKGDIPSIPAQRQSFGYAEMRDGTLEKLMPPKRDDSIGPAFYEQNLVETRATRQYRGVHFGMMAPRRTELSPWKSEAPGPGTYDLGGIRDGGVEERTAGGTATSFARPVYHIPRYNEAIIKETRRQNLPGPGRYQIRSQFDPVPYRITPVEGMEVEKPPFLSQAKRFLPIKNAVPAPGSYNDPRHALDLLNRLTGLTRSPFGQTSLRFRRSSRVKGTPGPGTYSSPGMGAECLRKAYHESTRKGVFGTTATRAFPDRQENLPGPAHYQPKDRTHYSHYGHPSVAFSSVTNRMTEPSEMVKEVPPPGSYNVARSHTKSQVRTEMAKPRTPTANLKHASFVSFAPRFLPVQDHDVPGPGTYTTENMLTKGGLMVYRDKRFRGKVDSKPCPTTYEFSPVVQDTVLRGTFNVTLNNPLAQRPTLTPPGKSVSRAGSPALSLA